MNLDKRPKAAEQLSIPNHNDNQTLNQCVKAVLDHYFIQLNGHETADLYELVIKEVERPLLQSVMDQANGNQSRAASMLGISRSTLRKKLALHGLN
jgi:Fis family transcriptional regulator